VWCEDTGSGFAFWKKLFASLYKDYIVESKKNNTELCKAVSRLKSDEENMYYVLMDNAIDNPDVLRETQRLYYSIKGKNNVAVIKIHSFEFVLLSFRMLEDWVFAKEDDLKKSRRNLLDFKTEFVSIICNGGDAASLSEMKKAASYSDKLNSEQISAKLLFEITRNTGFETDKGKLGDCFTVSCCEWENRQSDDICGLDDRKLTSDEKLKNIFDNSILKDSFAGAGL
jgi:hypothetical protein